MKPIMLFLCAFVISSASIAQQNTHHSTIKEGVVLLNGKMWFVKALTGSMTLDNGTIVDKDCTIKSATGKSIKLTEGKCIDFHGKIKSSFDKTALTRGVMTISNNTVWVWSVLEKPMRLHNGSYAMPDGTLKLSSGKYQPLKNKDYLDFDGNVATVTL